LTISFSLVRPSQIRAGSSTSFSFYHRNKIYSKHYNNYIIIHISIIKIHIRFVFIEAL